jgi:hypothetical protein
MLTQNRYETRSILFWFFQFLKCILCMRFFRPLNQDTLDCFLELRHFVNVYLAKRHYRKIKMVRDYYAARYFLMNYAREANVPIRDIDRLLRNEELVYSINVMFSYDLLSEEGFLQSGQWLNFVASLAEDLL